MTYNPSNIRDSGIRVLRSSNIAEDQFTYGEDDVFVEPDAANIPYANRGDILITSANGSTRLVGKHAIIRDIPDNSAVHGGFMLLARAKNSEFVNALMSAPWYSKFISLYVAGGNGAIGNLNKNDLDEQDVLVPEDTEQKAIGQYFEQLDNLITLHQREYDKIVQVKKSMLEKMFPKNGSNVPEIRFEGFTDAWEQRKLSEYLEVSNQKNTDDTFTKQDVLSVSGDFGIVNQIEFQGRSFAGASISNYGIVNTGDVVYTKSPLNSNPYGIIKANKGNPGIVSTLYAVYHPKSNVDSSFVQTYFEQHARMNNYMHPLVNKGAKNDMKVSSENALKGYVIFPDIAEQRQIVALFVKLDTLITLHQRKFMLFIKNNITHSQR